MLSGRAYRDKKKKTNRLYCNIFKSKTQIVLQKIISKSWKIVRNGIYHISFSKKMPTKTTIDFHFFTSTASPVDPLYVTHDNLHNITLVCV